MVIAIIILSILVTCGGLFIFLLMKVLKRSFLMIGNYQDLQAGKVPRSIEKAYNDVYYPATVVTQVAFGAPCDATIVDFSLYDQHGIVGIQLEVPETVREYYGKGEYANLTDEELNTIFCKSPVVFKDALVYEYAEGMWTWKQSQDCS